MKKQAAKQISAEFHTWVTKFFNFDIIRQ